MITLDSAKTHLRVDTDDEDADITAKLLAARRAVEEYTGLGIIQEERQVIRCANERLFLDFPPVLSKDNVTKVEYRNTNGDYVEVDAADYSLHQIYGCRPFIKFKSDFSFTDPDLDATDFIRITYESGFDEDAVPADLEAAILLILADLYENREASIVGTIRVDNPAAIALMHPKRVNLGV